MAVGSGGRFSAQESIHFGVCKTHEDECFLGLYRHCLVYFPYASSHLPRLCCRFGYGRFELLYDGDVVASYRAFDSHVTVEIGEGCEKV